MGIQAIHYQEVPAGAAKAKLNPSLSYWGIWPNPMNWDNCFQRAGWTEFEDLDDLHEEEFSALSQRLLAELSKLGAIFVKEQPFMPENKTVFSKILSLFKPSPPVVYPPLDMLLAACDDDRVGPCTLQFGTPPVAEIRSSYGHYILWVGLAPEQKDRFLEILSLSAPNKSIKKSEIKLEDLI